LDRSWIGFKKICLFLLTFAAVLLMSQAFPGKVSAQTVTRLTTDDPAAIRLIRNNIAKDNSYRIVFIGDSLIYSSASPQDKDTLASYFSGFIDAAVPDRIIHVYDLSLPGGSFVSSYELIKYILSAHPNMVVFDVNVGWFGTAKPEHIILKSLNTTNKIAGAKPVKVGVFPADLYLPWYQKDFSSLSKTTGKLGNFAADRKNPQWAAFQDSVQLLKNSKIPSVLYFPPRNEALYYKYNLIDENALSQKNDLIRKLVEGPTTSMFDYTWLINSNYFSDPAHLLPEGSWDLAQLLSKDVAAGGLP
jgi:hypothetical protein